MSAVVLEVFKPKPKEFRDYRMGSAWVKVLNNLHLIIIPSVGLIRQKKMVKLVHNTAVLLHSCSLNIGLWCFTLYTLFLFDSL